ncbi:MAG: hypothetical protein RR360_01125, partial [Raoultibacter sp.]
MTQAARNIDEVPPFKRQVYCAVEDVRQGNIIARVLGISIFVLIVANVASLLFETDKNLSAMAQEGFSLFGIISAVCFA